jgi:lysophospholipase L1-like esterase
MKKHLYMLISCLLALCIFTGCDDDDAVAPATPVPNDVGNNNPDLDVTVAPTTPVPNDVGSNDPDLFVAIGDSITRGYGLSDSQSYPAQLSAMLGKPVINEGRDGEKTDSGKSRISDVLRNRKPGYILILYGASDIIYSYASSDTLNNLRSMVQTAKNNKTIPIIATLTPAFGGLAFMEAGINRLNPLIRQMAADEGVSVANLDTAIDWDIHYMLSDGIHPNYSGQTLIAQTFYRVITQ